MIGKEKLVDAYVSHVEHIREMQGPRKYTNCGVRYEKKPYGSVVMDRGEYISSLRPIVSQALTGAPPDKPPR
eukprot:8867342-Lingulodinium_polyedra.AAC.1